ncbi:hypothetical protein FTUN_0069 [Frigoriglobus tundricola]|uniref:Uncharacterized protein n=1 Tax=Frigoriglobus tundricola TaxID=2774151 RepID=A0A6M5YH51_9BACT|nr:hypothetical protein FTUN_0069 [Frigoriglobus tundricola]
MSALRDRLQALVGRDDDPFHPNRPGQPYRARFTIRRAGPATFPTPPGATWGAVSLTETGPGVVEAAVTTRGRGVARVRGDGPGDRGRWEGTTQDDERRLRYTLRDLGMTGPDGAPTAGASLVAVLRAGGRLARSAGDKGMLALSGALARFFQLDDPPFTFDPKRGQWVAQFEATSTVPAPDR